MTETIRFGNFSGLRRSRQWRSSFVPRQATYLAAHRPGVPGRVVTFTDFKTWPNSMPNTTHPSHPRQWYSRAPGGPNYQHRSEFCFSLAENPQAKHQASSLRLAAKVTPPPQPGLGMYKRTLRDPAQVAGNLNSKIKFGVHQRLAESGPLIAGASKAAVPLLYLHACSGCNGEARRSRSRAHPGSGPVTDPGPSIFHKPPPSLLLGYCGSSGRLTQLKRS